MKNKKDNCLLTPIGISQGEPIYNAHGRVTGYGVRMRYYVGKMFMYVPDSDKNTETDKALQWVCKMEENGYKLIRSPKFHDSPHCGGFDVYMICDYTYRFNEFPFFNAGKRAWRFWLKKQNEVAAIKKQHDLMQKINENTK